METATTIQQGLDLSAIGDFITKVGFPIAFILGVCFLLYKVYTDILAPYFKRKLNSSIKKTSEDSELLKGILNDFKLSMEGRIDKQEVDITELKSEIKDIRTEQRKDKEDFLSAIKEITTSFDNSLAKFDTIKTDVESIKETVSKATPKKTTTRKKPTVQK